jgi:hypothetical protein
MTPHTPAAHAARPAPVEVTVHPPERRRRHSSVIAAQACCCCCCCCCLHTIGGLIGGLVGSLLHVRPSPPVPSQDEDSPFPFRRDEPGPSFTLSAALVYWVLFSLLSLGTFLYFLLENGPGSREPIWAGIGTVLVMPGVQLAASLLAVLVAAVCPRGLMPDKRAALVRIGTISLWAFVGGLVGMLLMLPLMW